MKKSILSLIVIMLTGILSTPAAFADETITETADNLGFSPELAQEIREYKGTTAPALPKMPKRKLVQRANTTAPGRMVVPRNLVINKEGRNISMVTPLGDVLLRFPICSSANRGQKRGADDSRTPEGTFRLYGVYNSTDWTYKDTGQKCYGPWFLYLITPPYYGIGVHGTNAPYSVPGRSSHGCTRLHNEDIVVVKNNVQRDTRVTVLPDNI